jgi:transcription termination/antitermination protein NusG
VSTAELAQWFVVRTRSRQEKALAAELSLRGLEYFLPLVRCVRFHGREGGRRVVVEQPMIPGYLFLRSSLDEAYLTDRSQRTAQLMKVADQDRLAWEIENLRDAAARGAELMPYAHLPNGTRVEVCAGPLRGIQGVVDMRKGNRLILQITALGQAMSLEIDGSLLERMDG